MAVIECTCRRCDKQFTLPASRVAAGAGKFCSEVCRRPPIIVNCAWCGKSFRGRPAKLRAGAGRYCSQSCARKSEWVDRPPALRAQYHYASAPGHPIATKNGSILTHRKMLYDKIGPGPHACHWCRRPIDWNVGGKTAAGALVVDHLDDNGRNNALNNLVPSCHGCNSSRGKSDLVGDNEVFILMGRGRHRAERRNCAKCGAEFAHLLADKRPNRGRFCSRSCARSQPRGS